MSHKPWQRIRERIPVRNPLSRQESAADSEETPAKEDLSKTKMIEKERARLFENGSNFKETHREHIVGIDDVLDEIDDIIHWLRYSEAYLEYESRLEPGIILAGQPGTGKTSTSRYIATEAGGLFINVRDFPHEGALHKDSDIHELFEYARKAYAKDKKPVILFWDEFEGVAAERSEVGPSQAAVVSQLTAELEGVHGKNAGILMIGCTNYLSSIDRALCRSGRLGMQFEFHAPDRKGKQLILTHYLSTMKLAEEIDTETLSHFFDRNATAADIEEACVEAWRNAVRRSIENEPRKQRRLPSLEQTDLVKVFIRRLVGPPTTFKVPESERVRIAIHEIGHAVVAMAYGVPVRLITVQPGKKSLGRTMCDDVLEYVGTLEDTVDWLRVGAGGMAAERVAETDLMVGSTGDISMINEQAAVLIDQMNYGQSTGLFSVGGHVDVRKKGYNFSSPNISEEAVLRSDREIKYLVDRIEREANQVMEALGKDALWELAHTLNEKVTMTGGEFEKLFHEVVERIPEALQPQPKTDDIMIYG